MVAQCREESDGDTIYTFCRSLEWQKTNGPLPDDWLHEPSDPAERWRLEEFFNEHGGVEGVAQEIAQIAKRLKARMVAWRPRRQALRGEGR